MSNLPICITFFLAIFHWDSAGIESIIIFFNFPSQKWINFFQFAFKNHLSICVEVNESSLKENSQVLECHQNIGNSLFQLGISQRIKEFYLDPFKFFCHLHLIHFVLFFKDDRLFKGFLEISTNPHHLPNRFHRQSKSSVRGLLNLSKFQLDLYDPHSNRRFEKSRS